ncbi:acyl carrier protein [Kibdelosporangium banguiense]|uniref:acyl carrier protein n=1 Tax=Kibdelosporangium banguiense TaxID=1365924 RepID=UPI003556E07A
MFVDLADPAGGYEAALLLTGELGCVAVVASIHAVDPGELSATTRLDELGFDSLDRIRLATRKPASSNADGGQCRSSPAARTSSYRENCRNYSPASSPA